MFDQEQSALRAYVALLEVCDQALCAEVDTELWFPEKGQSAAAAKTLCFACPIRTACLEYALAAGEIGVWGGTSENDRRQHHGVTRRSRGSGGDDMLSPGGLAKRRERARAAERVA